MFIMTFSLFEWVTENFDFDKKSFSGYLPSHNEFKGVLSITLNGERDILLILKKHLFWQDENWECSKDQNLILQSAIVIGGCERQVGQFLMYPLLIRYFRVKIFVGPKKLSWITRPTKLMHFMKINSRKLLYFVIYPCFYPLTLMNFTKICKNAKVCIPKLVGFLGGFNIRNTTICFV